MRDLPAIASSRRILIDLSYPFYFVVDASVSGVHSAFSGVFHLRKVSSENKELKEKLQKALTQAGLNQDLKEENQHLRRLLGFKQRRPYALLSAQVIGRAPSSWFKQVIIDRGKADGIKEGAAVINEEGVVGQVTAVNRHNSSVLLLTDFNSRVSCSTLKSRVLGVILGQLSYPLLMKYVLTSSSVDEGEEVLTSAASSIFPAGLAVGRIKSVKRNKTGLFYEIEVASSVDFSKLDKIFVVQ